MSEEEPTQAMPEEDQREGPRDASGENDGLIPRNKRGGGPREPEHADGDFHGGQTGAAYHGYGQLGEENVEGQKNVNAPSEDP